MDSLKKYLNDMETPILLKVEERDQNDFNHESTIFNDREVEDLLFGKSKSINDFGIHSDTFKEISTGEMVANSDNYPNDFYKLNSNNFPSDMQISKERIETQFNLDIDNYLFTDPICHFDFSNDEITDNGFTTEFMHDLDFNVSYGKYETDKDDAPNVTYSVTKDCNVFTNNFQSSIFENQNFNNHNFTDGDILFRVLNFSNGKKTFESNGTVSESKSSKKSKNATNKSSVGRFVLQPVGKSLGITLSESNIQCLSILINYNDYRGILTGKPIINKSLVNCARHEDIPNSYQNRFVSLFEYPNGIPSPVSAVWQRIKYLRNIDALNGSISNIIYRKNSVFDWKHPYEPEYYRFELDKNENLINESKSGLCPYCEKIKFLPFKNSSYLSHLTLEHGIYSNNYIIPEGLYHGKYLFRKTPTDADENVEPESPSSQESEHQYTYSNSDLKRSNKMRESEGLVCPACFELLEVGCWKIKLNPLLSYFRHFKKCHKDLTSTNANFQTNSQLQINNRGRKLKIEDG